MHVWGQQVQVKDARVGGTCAYQAHTYPGQMSAPFSNTVSGSSQLPMIIWLMGCGAVKEEGV